MRYSKNPVLIWLLAGMLAVTTFGSVQASAQGMTGEAAAAAVEAAAEEETVKQVDAPAGPVEDSPAVEIVEEEVSAEEEVIIEELDASEATAPEKPKLVKIVNSSNGPRITWNPVAGVDAYHIMRKDESGVWQKYANVSGADSSTYTDSKAESGKTYSYSVRCIKDGVKSAYNKTGKTITFLTAPKAVLTNVIAGIRLNWAAIKGAESYVIYERDSNDVLHVLGATTELTYTVSGLSSGSTYRYTVRALTGSSYSGYSTVSGRWLKSPAVTVNSTDRGVDISWKIIKGAHYYTVYRKTASGSLQLLGTTPGLFWRDSTVPSAGSWSYCVRACDSTRKSSYITKVAVVDHVHGYQMTGPVPSGVQYVCADCGHRYVEQTLPETFGQYLPEAGGLLQQARDAWELAVPDVSRVNRAPEKSVADIPRPEYVQGSDGIYYSAEPEGNGIATILLTGDLMCQRDQQKASMKKFGCYNFADGFYYVSPILRDADLTVGNLESCLAESYSYMSEEYTVDGRYNCNGPSTYLEALRTAGFDLVSTANNHCADAGTEGIFQTLGHLDQYGMMHTGTFRSAEDPRYLIVDVDGIRVGFLAYTTKTNSLASLWNTEGQNVLLNLYSRNRVRADVAAAKAAGAEYIIAYNHWGTEYTNVSNASERAYAAEMAEAGVDYIVGSHPHALQEYDVLTTSDGREVPVAYSLGNFISHQTRTMSKETVILKLELVREPDGRVVRRSEGYLPGRVYTTYAENNYTVLPVGLPYSQGLTSVHFPVAWDDIQSVLGPKISPIGTRRQ